MLCLLNELSQILEHDAASPCVQKALELIDEATDQLEDDVEGDEDGEDEEDTEDEEEVPDKHDEESVYHSREM